MREIVLASKSPRRRELLQMLGFDFSIAVSDIDETIEPMSPSETYLCKRQWLSGSMK